MIALSVTFHVLPCVVIYTPVKTKRIYAAVDPEAPSTLKDGGVIAKGYHAEVDELRSIRDNTKGVLA